MSSQIESCRGPTSGRGKVSSLSRAGEGGNAINEQTAPMWPDRAMSRFMPVGIDFSGPLARLIHVSSSRSRPIHQTGLD
jgi:hypothetical protein